jgi:hypothetical protein
MKKAVWQSGPTIQPLYTGFKIPWPEIAIGQGEHSVRAAAGSGVPALPSTVRGCSVV